MQRTVGSIHTISATSPFILLAWRRLGFLITRSTFPTGTSSKNICDKTLLVQQFEPAWQRELLMVANNYASLIPHISRMFSLFVNASTPSWPRQSAPSAQRHRFCCLQRFGRKRPNFRCLIDVLFYLLHTANTFRNYCRKDTNYKQIRKKDKGKNTAK